METDLLPGTFGLIVKLVELTGIPIQSFLLVSVLVCATVAAIRGALKKFDLEDKKWWKLVLFGICMAVGLGITFIANATGNYGSESVNWADLVIIGIANGLVADPGWKLMKLIPLIRQRVTVVPPKSGGSDSKKK